MTRGQRAIGPVTTVAAVAVLAMAALATSSSPAEAGELQLDGGIQLATSTWRGDYGGGTTLRFGYRFMRVVAVDVLIAETLMGVDTRLDTGLTLGVTGAIPFETVRPTLRAFAIHQHEEPLISAAEAPAGTLFGIGAGIRHRAGGGGTLGLEIPFAKKGDLEGVIRPTTTFVVLSEGDIGPQAYFTLGVSLGLNYALEKLP